MSLNTNSTHPPCSLFSSMRQSSQFSDAAKYLQALSPEMHLSKSSSSFSQLSGGMR